MEDEFDNPWKELAENGITRPDQIEDYKDWLAVRISSLDRLKKRFDAVYDTRSPRYNKHILDEIEAAQFRYDFDRWALKQFIEGLDDDDSQEIQGI